MENNFSVYQHVTPDGMYYFGQTSNIKRRWSNNGAGYKGTALYPYIEKFGWDNIKHIVLFKDQTRENALWIEDFLIISGWEKGNCINKIRSGNIKKEDWYVKKLHKNYYNKNKDNIKEQHKQYYETNKEQILEQKKQYYETNKEQILEQKKQYYETNKDKKREYNRQYREQNREKYNEYNRKYREQNKEQIREYQRQYRKHKKLEKQLKEVETTLF